MKLFDKIEVASGLERTAGTKRVLISFIVPKPGERRISERSNENIPLGIVTMSVISSLRVRVGNRKYSLDWRRKVAHRTARKVRGRRLCASTMLSFSYRPLSRVSILRGIAASGSRQRRPPFQNRPLLNNASPSSPPKSGISGGYDANLQTDEGLRVPWQSMAEEVGSR